MVNENITVTIMDSAADPDIYSAGAVQTRGYMQMAQKAVCDAIAQSADIKERAEIANAALSEVDKKIAEVDKRIDEAQSKVVAASNIAQGITDIYNNAIATGTVQAPAIDVNLNTTDAAADAKATGDRLRNVELLGKVENCGKEYLRVYTDYDGRVLFSINQKGEVDWAKGVPQPIKEKLQDEINLLKQELADAFNDIDNKIKAYGDLEYNPEFLRVYTDNDNNIIFSIDRLGNVNWAKGVPQPIVDYINNLELNKYIDNPEYLMVVTDNEDTLISAIEKNGEYYVSKLKAKNIIYSQDNIKDLKSALKNYGEALGCGDWSEAKSINIPKPKFATVNISGVTNMPTTKTQDDKAYIEFWDMQGNYFKKKIILNAQGASSMAHPKKNFAVDLCNDDWAGDDTFKVKFGDWVPQDSFHFKAYYTEYFKGIAVVGYKVFDEVWGTRGFLNDRPWKKALVNIDKVSEIGDNFGYFDNKNIHLDNGARNFPDGFPCVVYLNNEFYGVFSMQLKKHRDNMQQKKDVPEHVHFEALGTLNLFRGIDWWTQVEIRNPKTLYCMDGSKYEGDINQQELIDETSEFFIDEDVKVQKDKRISAKVKQYIKSLSERYLVFMANYRAYKDNPTEEAERLVKAEFETMFDVDNLLDYFITMDILQDIDSANNNAQWCTYDGVKWYICPYDLDNIFGNWWDGKYLRKPDGQHFIAIYHQTYNTSIKDYTWFPAYTAYQLYKNEARARYAELRDKKIFDAEHITELLDDWTKRVGIANYEAEYKKWANSNFSNDTIVNDEYWELVLDENGKYVLGGTKNYDINKTYSVGDTCTYITSTVPYSYTFKCLKSNKGNAPLLFVNRKDSIFRLYKWLNERIFNMDSVYKYNV